MNDQNINKSISDDGSTATVCLSGSLGIEKSGELHRVLAESLNESQRVVLDMQHLEEIDMTSMQVLCSTCKTAAAQKLGFVCETKIPDCLLSLCKGIGAPQSLSCNQNAKEPCIWFGGRQ